jgi:predicted TIM-barrel fold metal-dependent hydrolase
MHVPGPPEFKIGSFSIEDAVESADRLGINEMWVSVPISGGRFAPIEEVRMCNDCTLEALRRFPDRFIGYCFVIPGMTETLDEIERCLDAGMSGIKLYNQYKYSEPVLDPIAEKAIEHGIPILGHAGRICDPQTQRAQPRCSDASDFVALAKRYPDVMLIEGHISGGGDWEWSVRELRDFPNVYLDTSGSNVDDRTIEMCVEMLGAERILFATDMSMEAGIGKILSAELTDEQAELIWWKNMQRIRDRRK